MHAQHRNIRVIEDGWKRSKTNKKVLYRPHHSFRSAHTWIFTYRMWTYLGAHISGVHTPGTLIAAYDDKFRQWLTRCVQHVGVDDCFEIEAKTGRPRLDVSLNFKVKQCGKKCAKCKFGRCKVVLSHTLAFL